MWKLLKEIVKKILKEIKEKQNLKNHNLNWFL